MSVCVCVTDLRMKFHLIILPLICSQFCFYVDCGIFSYFFSPSIDVDEGWNMVEEFAIFFNLIRYKHHAPQLLINNGLVLAARERAVQYVKGQAYDQQMTTDESVYFNPDINDEVTASEVIDEWYSKSEKEYDYDNPKATEDNMNFLRIVSKTTTEFGCGQAKTRSIGSYTVCLYTPRYEPGDEKINIEEPLEDFDARQKYEHIRALVRSDGVHLESPLVNFSEK